MPTHQYQQNTFVWGAGCCAELPSLLETADVERAMVVCGENVGSNRFVMDAVTEAVGDRLVGIFDGARANAPVEQIREGLAQKREWDADGLVSVGGGSATDTAKAIAVLDGEEGRDVHELKSRTKAHGEVETPPKPAEKDPIFAVATTLSAAEVSNGFGVTDYEAGEKMVLYDEKIRPKACIYDPDLAAKTPPAVLASTGMNALDHSVEILYSDVRAENPFYQATAQRSIELLIENLGDAVDDPDDSEAMQQTLLGAALSGIGLTGGVCINHAINHAVCAQHPVSHGDGNSVLLPHGIRFNGGTVPERITRIANSMGVQTDDRPIPGIVEETCDRITALQERIDVPRRFREVDVERSGFEKIATVAVDDPGMACNPRPVTEEDILTILENAW